MWTLTNSLNSEVISTWTDTFQKELLSYRYPGVRWVDRVQSQDGKRSEPPPVPPQSSRPQDLLGPKNPERIQGPVLNSDREKYFCHYREQSLLSSYPNVFRSPISVRVIWFVLTRRVAKDGYTEPSDPSPDPVHLSWLSFSLSTPNLVDTVLAPPKRPVLFLGLSTKYSLFISGYDTPCLSFELLFV